MFKRVGRGAVCSCEVAEFCWKQLYLMSGGLPLEPAYHLLQRLKQRRARARNAAAHDPRLRVEHVDQGADGARKGAHALLPDLARREIAGLRGGDQFMSRREPAL